MTGAELEAVVWRHLGPRYAFREEARRAVEAIMDAALLYREDTPAVTAQRRAALLAEDLMYARRNGRG